MPTYKLLSSSSVKIDKSNKIQDKYFSRIMYLAPHNLADGKNTVCPYSTIAKCPAPCLNLSGNGFYNSVQKARIRKTLMFLNDKGTFMTELFKDIFKFEKECKDLGKLPALRLNGTSDIQWETIKIKKDKSIFEYFPDVQFYDYTKIPTRKVDNIPNYHLTWSYSEANDKYAKLFDSVTENKAVVFRDELPSFFKGLKVIDGDKHDMRFLDEPNVVVGLKAKAKARTDYSGFVIDNLIEARAII